LIWLASMYESVERGRIGCVYRYREGKHYNRCLGMQRKWAFDMWYVVRMATGLCRYSFCPVLCYLAFDPESMDETDSTSIKMTEISRTLCSQAARSSLT